MSFILLYVTHPSKPEAIRITVDLMNARLIACANYYPTESIYWWEGRLTKSEEVMTIYKTTPENYESIKTRIESLHKNEVPCIIKLATVEANSSYEDWIHSQVHYPHL